MEAKFPESWKNLMKPPLDFLLEEGILAFEDKIEKSNNKGLHLSTFLDLELMNRS